MKCVSFVRRVLVALLGLISLTAAKPAAAEIMTWGTVTVDDPPQGIAGGVSAIAVDYHKFPHIAYIDSIEGSLKYAYRDSAGWHVETVLGPESVSLGIGISLAIDNADMAHISYYTHKDYETKGDIKYGLRNCDWFNGQKFCWWHHELIAKEVQSPFDQGNTSIVLTNTGTPHVAYLDNAHGQVVWAKKEQGGTWSTSNLVAAPGGFVSITLDSLGAPQFLYSDQATGQVRHARFMCFFIFCGLNFTTIDTGMAGTLRLTQTNQPRLSYWQSGQIKYAEGTCNGNTPCSWSTTVIDSVGNSSYRPTLALSPGGTPSIAYLRPRGGNLADLMYARPERLFGWTKQIAYQASGAYAQISLALDGNNYPLISHQIATSSALGFTRGGPLVFDQLGSAVAP